MIPGFSRFVQPMQPIFDGKKFNLKFAKVESVCLPLTQNGSVAIMGTPLGGHHLLGPLHLVVPLRRLLLRCREALPLPVRLQEARAEGRH